MEAEKWRQGPFPHSPGHYPGSVDTAWFQQQIVLNPTGDNTQQGHAGGSYAANGWLVSSSMKVLPGAIWNLQVRTRFFSHRWTPVFGDGVQAAWVGLGFGPFEGPRANDLPPRDLEFGVPDARSVGMGAFAIPRHGSRPDPVPNNHPPNARLRGAVNISFWDGHVELVPVERLWPLTWHRNYQAPAKRLDCKGLVGFHSLTGYSMSSPETVKTSMSCLRKPCIREEFSR